MDRKKNGLVILGLLLVIAIIAGISLLMPKDPGPAAVTVTDPGGLITTLAPDIPEEDDDEDDRVEFSEQAPDEPRGWLFITVNNKTYEPYPLTRTGDYTINQKKKNMVNVIHVTPVSIQMASSTCDNQLCVTEGEVTLENKAGRILGNYIICLPNGVTLELLNAEEYAEWQSSR